MDSPAHGIANGPSRDFGPFTYRLPDGITVERDIRVAMRDGNHLAVTVFRPDRPGRFPVVMCVTAYGKDFGPDQYAPAGRRPGVDRAVGTFHVSDVTPRGAPDPGFWVPNGYCLVIADARGFFDSEGLSGVVTHDDAADYAELIDWAGMQCWSSGAVGLNGVSYLAMSQWNCASRTQSVHLKAMIPWEAPNDLGRDSLVHGGIPETWFRKVWGQGALSRGGGPDWAARAPALLRQLIDDPMPVQHIVVPVLVCASWSCPGLHARGSFEGFMRVASSQKWLYTHGRPIYEVYYSPDALEWQKSFFDHFLKEEDNGFESRPRVRLEVRRTKEDFTVRREAAWPIERTAFTRLFLDARHGLLSADMPAEDHSAGYDSEVGDVTEFDFQCASDMELTGPMVLKLWVSAEQADDLDLFVALRKIDRSGREVHFYGTGGYRDSVVALGWLRASHRRRDPARSTPWRPVLSHNQPEKVSPGEIVDVEIEILPSSTVFQAGDRLRLTLRGCDILEEAELRHEDTINRGRHVVHAGGQYDSYLLIPVVGSENT